MTCGQDTELEGAAPCDTRVEADICTGGGSSHQLVTVRENVVLRANCPCDKSDSTQLCQEEAAHSAVLPSEN